MSTLKTGQFTCGKHILQRTSDITKRQKNSHLCFSAALRKCHRAISYIRTEASHQHGHAIEAYTT